MPTLQSLFRTGRRLIPSGWSPLLRGFASLSPRLRRYPARMENGDRLYLDLRERMCHGYFFFGNLPHERGTEVLLRSVLRPGGGFVDIGANVGYYTRLASHLVGAEGTVYAFEPMPAALDLLRLNSSPLDNVRVLPLALSDRPGEAEFSIRAHGDTSSLGGDPQARSRIRVRVSTADAELAGAARIDLIKIDVEGYELEVLRGARETIERHQPVVYFEFLPSYLEQRGYGMEDFADLFAGLGYGLNWINHTDPERDLFSAEPSSYLIATPGGRPIAGWADQRATTSS